MDQNINWNEAKILKLQSDDFIQPFTKCWYLNSKWRVITETMAIHFL